jgi:hypothetical protein
MTCKPCCWDVCDPLCMCRNVAFMDTGTWCSWTLYTRAVYADAWLTQVASISTRVFVKLKQHVCPLLINFQAVLSC